MRWPPVLVASLITVPATSPSAQASASADTIRVGSVGLRPVEIGVDDSVESTFEMRLPSGEVQKRTQHSVRRWVVVPLGRDTVVRRAFVSGGPPAATRFDYYIDQRTLAVQRYEQRTNIDSALVVAENGCMTGWVHLEKQARRTVSCDRTTDRFGASPIDEYVVAHLPMLQPGFAAVLATYGAVGGPGGYAFRVVGADLLQVGGHPRATWRVERTIRTDQGGTYTTVLWIDQLRARILQVRRDFGNGRVATDRVTNP